MYDASMVENDDIGTKPQTGAAAVVLPCAELDTTLTFFTEQLGFRIDAVFPADHPLVVEISGHGLRIRLQRGATGTPAVLRLECDDPDAIAGCTRELTAPNGTRIELVATNLPLSLPPLQSSLVVNRMGSDAKWQVGRAGMLYRDLIPDRQGGRFIASHIRIPEGGLVPDYVHYHKIHFQMIYCYKGWVRVVYESQGAPLMMQAGDCVLQPPRIRHRVLECSPGLEVIEIGCPAEHETRADHDMALPTPTVLSERDFSGQQFVHHTVSSAQWQPWGVPGFEYRDMGIAAATHGLATVHVVRATGDALPQRISHDAQFCFTFVLQGTFEGSFTGRASERLAAGDSFVVPAAQPYELAKRSDDLELLQVRLL